MSTDTNDDPRHAETRAELTRVNDAARHGQSLVELAAADGTPPRRPWSHLSEDDNAWSEFGAWEQWMAARWDGMLPEGSDSAFDKVDSFDRCYLYALMCDLADGRSKTP